VIKKISRSHLSSRRRGGQIGETLRPEEIRRTSIEASPCRARASRHPVCGASVASRLLISAPDTPPFQGRGMGCPLKHSANSFTRSDALGYDLYAASRVRQHTL